MRGLRNLVFVGLKFFFLGFSLASSSSRAAKMSAIIVVVELKREKERGERSRYTSACGDGVGESCMVHRPWWLCTCPGAAVSMSIV